MAKKIAEVLKVAARPTPHDKNERTWLAFRLKLESYLTLVNERYVQILQDAESQLVAIVPAGPDEASVLIRTLSHTLYASLATLTTERGLRLVPRAPKRHGSEVWRHLVAENAPKTPGYKFAMLQAVLQPGMGDNPAKLEETWKAWEHQVDVYENLAASKLDDDVKISAVLREAPPKLRDNLLMNSQQFDSNYNKLPAIIQAYLNSHKSWIAKDFRSDTKEQTRWKLTTLAKKKNNGKGNGKGKGNDNGKGNGKGKGTTAKKQSPTYKTKSATCAERKGTSYETAGDESTKTKQ